MRTQPEFRRKLKSECPRCGATLTFNLSCGVLYGSGYLNHWAHPLCQPIARYDDATCPCGATVSAMPLVSGDYKSVVVAYVRPHDCADYELVYGMQIEAEDVTGEFLERVQMRCRICDKTWEGCKKLNAPGETILLDELRDLHAAYPRYIRRNFDYVPVTWASHPVDILRALMPPHLRDEDYITQVKGMFDAPAQDVKE